MGVGECWGGGVNSGNCDSVGIASEEGSPIATKRGRKKGVSQSYWTLSQCFWTSGLTRPEADGEKTMFRNKRRVD